MSYIKFFRYVGIALVLFSLTLGFMLDCNYFDTQEVVLSCPEKTITDVNGQPLQFMHVSEFDCPTPNSLVFDTYIPSKNSC